MDGNILHGLSGDIPIFDEICKRSLRFIVTCMHHSCDLIRFLHGMVLQVLVALHYLVEMSILARFGIILKSLSFWPGLSMLMLC